MNDCRKCRFLDRETARDIVRIGGWRYICVKRGGMANMLSFPFHSTKCQVWEEGKLKPLEERKHIPGQEPTT